MSDAAAGWFERRTFHHRSFGDLGRLRELKENQGATISVCIPARNEAATIGGIVRTVQDHAESSGLIDEVVVIDSESSDGTAGIAEEAGAVVYQDAEILPELEVLGGKGDALWKSLFALKGDLIVYLDADVSDLHAGFVTGLLGPLLEEPGIGYVKAFYERPLTQGTDVDPVGGGRVTELVARPLLALFWPELSGVIQPLSGEYAGRRSVLESVPFFNGYAVEIGLLIDILQAFGLDAIAQVDLEVRTHRNRSLHDLSLTAFGILQAAATRLAAAGRLGAPTSSVLRRFAKGEGGFVPEDVEVRVVERPPAASLPAYRDRA